jgi:hypothetical protein
MSKRKYQRDVSPLCYTYLVGNSIGRFTDTDLRGGVAVRVVRESFYRKLVKAYEEYFADKSCWIKGVPK